MAVLQCRGCGRRFEAAGCGEANCPECCRRFHKGLSVFWTFMLGAAVLICGLIWGVPWLIRLFM